MEKEQMTSKVAFSFIIVGQCLRYLFSATNVKMFNPNHSHLLCVLFYNHHCLHPCTPTPALQYVYAMAQDNIAYRETKNDVWIDESEFCLIFVMKNTLSWKPLQLNKNSPRLAVRSPALLVNSSSTWSKSSTLFRTQFPQCNTELGICEGSME